jgi:citrate lyase subunit beta/citryl-CoA lyase/(S)-citramalyl-CoA lyase
MNQKDPGTWRSLLFVPGSRPDRFEKAAAAGADLVCVDLEDAVAPAGKTEARTKTLAFLQDYNDRPCLMGLRINAIDDDFGRADLEALRGAKGLDFVMVPKVRAVRDIDIVSGAYGHPRIIPVIEQARAVQNAGPIADHSDVIAAIYGAIDLAADIGCSLDWEAHLYGRSACALAFGAARKTLFDVPYLDVEDDDGLIESTRRARGLGIHARACIHPRQITGVHKALAPDEAELAWARRVVDAFEAAEGGAALLDGKMIELPVIKSAQRILANAER